MSNKLKEYQVIDVFCKGTFYKVRHKVTNNIFAWKACNCSTFSDEQIQNIANEVKIISKVSSEILLRYYDTILHLPTKTLYFVLEYNSWRSVQELLDESEATDKYFAENFIWHLLHDLARVCKAIHGLNTVTLQKCITSTSVFVDEGLQLRVNCFELQGTAGISGLARQVGRLLRTLCRRQFVSDTNLQEFHYSDDLQDVVSFLTDERNDDLLPDMVLYHPTLLTSLEMYTKPTRMSEILVAAELSQLSSSVNKCDSEKAVEQSRGIEPLPRTIFNIPDSPIYCNLSPKRKIMDKENATISTRGSMSPTLAALALELPGYVPRSRKPHINAIGCYNAAQSVTEETFSKKWMSRLMTLRQREESLNKRERELIAKEILNSPSTKIIPFNGCQNVRCESDSNGITLPPVVSKVDEKKEWVSRRRHRRSGSARSKGRRKSYAYEDLDSSLSADVGDESMIVTAAKLTNENLPRNFFSDVSTKKVHFTATNPFTESDESVTLTFYGLDNTDSDGYQMPRQNTAQKDISKFKYLDLDNEPSSEKRGMKWSHSSPSKQAKMTNNIFGDITNNSTHSNIRKTPSKSSLVSKGSDSSRFSLMSCASQWSTESSVSTRTRSGARALQTPVQTPHAPPEARKGRRRSLLPFKTPFKFSKSSTKV